MPRVFSLVAKAVPMNNEDNKIVYTPYIDIYTDNIMDMYTFPSSSASAGYKQGKIGYVVSSGSFASYGFIIKRENFTLTYYAFDNGVINSNRIREFYVVLR
mgnify:CR=1 FL=1